MLCFVQDAIGDDEAFALFFSELQREALDSGQDIVDEAEAQELFSLFRNDDTEMMIVDPDEDFSVSSTSSTVSVPMSIVRPLNVTLQTPQLYNEAIETRMVPSDEEMRQTESRVFSPVWSTAEDALEFNDAQMEEENKNIQLEVLRHLLPALPDSRLKKILRTFQKSLGDPQLIDLISIVRENLPDYITATWLKQMSALTAKYVIAKAENDNLVNVELLNNALELLTLSGSLERAATFHSSEFAKNSVEQTGYSDRLLLQMLLSNNRFSRALSFKEKIEASGRKLDLKSYGALIAYCSSRQQLGSAMMLLTECVSVHNSPPSEASLFKLRLLYRQTNMVATVELDSLIGPDPVEWIRHGETNLKREMSKRGRRDIQLARNQLVRM